MSEVALNSVPAVNIIPSSPADLAKISAVIDDLVNMKTLQASYADKQKAAIDQLSADMKLSKTWIRQALNDRYNGSFDKKVKEQDEYECFYEKLDFIKQNGNKAIDELQDMMEAHFPGDEEV